VRLIKLERQTDACFLQVAVSNLNDVTEDAMNCTNCGTYNDASSRFCLKCGTAFSTPPTQTVLSNTSTASLPVQYQPTVTRESTSGGSGVGTFNAWGPFAGYGTRHRHVGWLMNGEGQRASELVAIVEAKFKERKIPGAYMYQTTLEGRGVFTERRPYFILHRGLANLALYITQFGRDLFISQASYLKPPISNFRVIIATGMALFQVYMTFVFPASLNGTVSAFTSSFGLFGSGSNSGGASLAFLLCVVGPLGGANAILLFILACFSIYKWLTEKDFWAALRVPPNEFNEDDLMAMEKVVEETVRQSLTELKLNPDDLKATASAQNNLLF
jgi:hypothetical protein